MPRPRPNALTGNVVDFVATRLFAAGTRRTLRLAQREWPRLPSSARTFYRRLAREAIRLATPVLVT